MPAPTLSDAHYVRIASAFRKDRKKIKATFRGHFPLTKWIGSEGEKPGFLEDLRKAVYAAFLAAFVQGINVIDLADQENRWSIDFSEVVKIWRGGCIIKADVSSTVYFRGYWLTLKCSILPICSRMYSRVPRTGIEIFSTMNE